MDTKKYSNEPTSNGPRVSEGVQALKDLVFVLETEQEQCHKNREYLEAMGVAIAIRRAKQMIDSRR